MKRYVKRSILFLLLLSLLLPAFSAAAADARVEKAIQLAIAIANDDTHGYSSDPTDRSGETGYDCSSLICSVFHKSGFREINPLSNTRGMIDCFKAAGFEVITDLDFSTSAALQRGDVLWRLGHTELYIGDNMLCGAHSDIPSQWGPNRSPEPGDLGDEITVERYYNNGWTAVLRYPSVTAPAPAFALGDVNGDGGVGADDARLALRRSVDLEAFRENDAAFRACDVNRDGSIGADDARLILRASVDLETI